MGVVEALMETPAGTSPAIRLALSGGSRCRPRHHARVV